MAARGADGFKFKKKKKDNFLRQAKRHAKRGNFGLGKRLSEEEYNYYMRVFEQLKHVDGEEKDILVRNFFNELEREGQVKSLASNQVISRILDDALPLADVKQVQALSQVFADDLRPTCIDPYASHVLQTLLTLSLKYGQRGAVQKRCEENDEGETKEIIIEVTDEEREEFNTFANKVGRFVYNNLEDFVCNTYASHVIRTVLEICSGVELQDSVKSSHRAQTTHALQKEVGKFITVPSKLKELLHDIAVRFTKLPNLSEIIQYDCGSAVLQSLLMVLRDVEEEQEQCQTLVTHILQHGLTGVSAYYDDGGNNEGVPVGLPTLFQDKPASRLLEVMIMSSTAEQQKEIFQHYFKGNMKMLVQHHSANFAVQKLMSSWKEKETFGELFEEVCEALEAATEAKHMGVVHALSQACRRLSSSQSRCVQALMQLLGCWEPERLQVQFAPMLLRMIPYKEYQAKHSEGNVPPISLQGALTLQELLHFHKPIKVVNSLLDMSVADLQMMACDPRGSHVVDAFVLSTFLGAKNREKFLNRFKGTCTSLACSKHGSRSLEALWKVASTKIKTQICSELVVDELKLKGSPFGIIIYKNFQVHMFRRGDKSDWQELIDQAEKKRKLFDDLLVESGGEQKKKKHKKKKKESLDLVEDIFIDTVGEQKKKKHKKTKKESLDLVEDIFIDTVGNYSD